MAISSDLIAHAASAIASVKGIEADADSIIEDAYLLSLAFTEPNDFLSAVANTQRAIAQLVEGTVSPAQLKYEHAGWLAYHYQHKVVQGQRADMRIIFCRTESGIRLRAYGHRSLPKDFYERVADTRGISPQYRDMDRKGTCGVTPQMRP